MMIDVSQLFTGFVLINNIIISIHSVIKYIIIIVIININCDKFVFILCVIFNILCLIILWELKCVLLFSVDCIKGIMLFN